MQKNSWDRWREELNIKMSKWLEEHADQDGEGEGYSCKLCNSALMSKTVHCSIHDGYKYFKSHAGSGRVHKFPTPECPNKGCSNHNPSFLDEKIEKKAREQIKEDVKNLLKVRIDDIKFKKETAMNQLYFKWEKSRIAALYDEIISELQKVFVEVSTL